MTDEENNVVDSEETEEAEASVEEVIEETGAATEVLEDTEDELIDEEEEIKD